MAKRNDTDKLDALLASVTDDMLGGDFGQQLHDDSIKVERILLDLVRPDPVQPRRVLPEQIHYAFHNNRLTPTQALKELVQLVQVTARQRGRPFNSVLELLSNPDDEREDDGYIKLSPEEQLLRDLVNLAMTIREDGQVNPLTVIDVSEGVSHLFRIETGERRYWAAWLLRDFIPGYSGDGMIPCIIVPVEQSSVFRQAKENTARSGLSAIAMARQAALLLLAVHGYEIPGGLVPAGFYRQALDLDLRGKREHTAEILSAMGGIDRSQFSRYKLLLRLCDEAFEMADRHSIDEGRLRYLVQLGPQEQVEMIRQIIQFGFTRKQVKDLIDHGFESGGKTSGEDDIPRPLMQLARLMKAKELPDPQSLASYLVSQEKNAKFVRARLHNLRQLLDEAERCLMD